MVPEAVVPPLGVKVAVMVVVPTLCKLATPALPAEKKATLVLDELQLVEAVTFWPFRVAWNCT